MHRTKGIVVTSEPIGAYGGFQFSEDRILAMQKQIDREGLRMGIEHDPRENVDAVVVGTALQRNEAGYLQLVLEWELTDEAWEKIEQTGMQALSISVTEPIRQTGLQPFASLAADAQWFSDEELALAHDDLAKIGGEVETQRLYQFAFDPPAMVILTFIVAQVPPFTVGLIANYVYDVLKHFIHRDSKPSIFSLEFEDLAAGTKRTAYLETNSNRRLKQAIQTLPDALSRSRRIQFEDEDGTWKDIDGES